jgi:plasmid stabilization system protein ParE
VAVILLPDAQDDLLSLQDYMLAKWGEALWLKAEDEIFEKLTAVDNGQFNGTPVKELAAIGIFDYANVLTSHHRIVYKKIKSRTYVYLFAGQQQDFQSLLLKRLFSR